jgi:hypothetical protein
MPAVSRALARDGVAIEVFTDRRAIVYARAVRRARGCASVGIRTEDVRSAGDRITGRVVAKSRTCRTDRASAGRVAEKPAWRAESRNAAQAEKQVPTGCFMLLHY